MSSSTTNLIGLGMSPALATLLGNPIVKTVTTDTIVDSSYDGAVIYSTAAGAITLTFPNALTTTVRFRCTIIQGGAGAVTVAASGGATIDSEGATLVSPGQYAVFSIVSPASGAFILSLGSGGGGGGGGNVETETGTSPIKISAFPAAATNMGSTDVVTGIQGGENVNFTQAQYLSGVNGPSGTGGYPLYVRGGNADAPSSRPGGILYLYGGNGGLTGNGGGVAIRGGLPGATSGAGGAVGVQGANGVVGDGGSVQLTGGVSNYGNGGSVVIQGGNGYGAPYKGGDIAFTLGIGGGGGGGGQLAIINLPNADPTASNAIFGNNGVLMQSGVANANGTYTIAGIGSKTITIANGIITSIA